MSTVKSSIKCNNNDCDIRLGVLASVEQDPPRTDGKEVAELGWLQPLLSGFSHLTLHQVVKKNDG